MYRVFGYFITRISEYADASRNRSPDGAPAKSSNPKSASDPSPSPSYGQKDARQDAEILHLSFSLRMVQHIVLGWGHADIVRDLVVKDRTFSALITDRLALNLLMICSRRSGLPPLILQLALNVFSSLASCFGPCVSTLVECMMKQVYLKAMIQASETFASQRAVSKYIYLLHTKQHKIRNNSYFMKHRLVDLSTQTNPLE